MMLRRLLLPQRVVLRSLASNSLPTVTPTLTATSLIVLNLSRSLATTTTTTTPSTTSSTTGSGRGGRTDKDKAAAEKLKKETEKIKLAEQKLKEQEATLKIKEKREKLKEKEKKEKEKEKERKLKEKLKATKEKEKAQKLKEKEKERKAKHDTDETLTTTASSHDGHESQSIHAPKTPHAYPPPPPKLPNSAWGLFLADFTASHRSSPSDPSAPKPTVSELARLAAPEYRSLSSSDKASLLERVKAERDAYPALYDTWVKGLSVDEIREENAIRARRKKLGIKKGSQRGKLRLEGEPKRPKSSFLLFSTAVRKGETMPEVIANESNILEQTKLIAAAWRGLDADAKAEFERASQADMARYHREKEAFDADLKAKSTRSIASTAV